MTDWVIKSVSLTKEHAEMVQRERIKLSKVLRDALDEIAKEKNGELLDNNAQLQRKVNHLRGTIEKMAGYMNERGLYDEFLQKTTWTTA